MVPVYPLSSGEGHPYSRGPARTGLDDVADLKAQICDATGICTERQRLIFEGQELRSPKARLADCLLCEGAALQLVLTGGSGGASRVEPARASVSAGDEVLVQEMSSARGRDCRKRPRVLAHAHRGTRKPQRVTRELALSAARVP